MAIANGGDEKSTSEGFKYQEFLTELTKQSEDLKLAESPKIASFFCNLTDVLSASLMQHRNIL